ncbi:MAG: hypothetical protein SFW36_18040 [Leptolyngbyaceae cyanobacterium bins.59]|nr:hypothetical protein [Leptolyngbyaceae cyanobacterium bins.59]
MPELLAVGIGLLGGVFIWQFLQQQQQRQQLETAFYRVLETQNGCISLIQLAAAARIDARAARQYLEEQVKLFDASLETDGDGDAFYRFPKLKS